MQKTESKVNVLNRNNNTSKMTWPKVILFAAAAAVYTAVMAIIPALENTSFSDIATYLEPWILFAVIIVVNCEKGWEAGLKCFVFFLISQPLIYLFQVPFSRLGWQIFQYYRYWGIITIATLPGGMIAWLVKKKNWLSVAVLSVANVYLAGAAVNYFVRALNRFPYHLLSSVFSLGLAVGFTFVLLKEKKQRTVALIVIALALAGFAVLNRMGLSW